MSHIEHLLVSKKGRGDSPHLEHQEALASLVNVVEKALHATSHVFGRCLQVMLFVCPSVCVCLSPVRRCKFSEPNPKGFFPLIPLPGCS